MRKIVLSFGLFFLSSFIFVVNTNAECSYKERKELLELSKKVDIVVEPKIHTIETTGTTSFSDEPVTLTYEEYSFDFLITGLKEDIYVKYSNNLNDEVGYIYSKDLVDGIYKFNVDDSSNVVTYYFKIYSLNNNCLAESFYSKKIIKPKYNYFSEYSICKDEIISKKEYCKKFVSKELNLTEEEFFNEVNKISVKESEKEIKSSLSIIDIIKQYWYIGVGLLFVILFVVILLLIKKKRERLI